MTTIIKIRRDTTTNWESTNPILADGELGLDITVDQLKVGDGTTAWLDLPYMTNGVTTGNWTFDGSTMQVDNNGDGTIRAYVNNGYIPNINIELESGEVALRTYQFKSDEFVIPDSSSYAWANGYGSISSTHVLETGTARGNLIINAGVPDNPGGTIQRDIKLVSQGTSTYTWTFDPQGKIELPSGVGITVTGYDSYSTTHNVITQDDTTYGLGLDYAGTNTLYVGDEGIKIYTNSDGTAYDPGAGGQNLWVFAQNGNLILPTGATLSDFNDGTSLNGIDYSQLYWNGNIGNGNPDVGSDHFTWAYVDIAGFHVQYKNDATTTNNEWTFTSDGNLLLPDTTRLVSGGAGVENSTEFGTDVSFGPPNFVWWDAAKKGQYIVIDDGLLDLNVYAEPQMGSLDYPILSSRAINASEKVMFSFNVVSLSDLPIDTAIGIANANVALTNYLGAGTSSIALYNNGVVYTNDTDLQEVNNIVAGDHVDVAVDRLNDLLWFRVNNDLWNADGAADPTTGTGGIDISGITGAVYPAVTLSYSATASVIAASEVSPYTVPTDFTFIGPVPASDAESVIRSSEIYMGAGTTEGRMMVDSHGRGIVYYGVEDTTLPGFSGMVSSDPYVTSQYQVGTDDGDSILLGATQPGGTLTSTDYRAALGVLNANLTVNGFYADSFGAIMSGTTDANVTSTLWTTSEGIGITNTLYPRNNSSIDIGTPDKTFDSIHVNNVKGSDALIIDGGTTFSYWYNVYGDINLNDDTYGSSVAYDSNGNLYVMGTYYDSTISRLDTLALKYSPDGDLIWRKSWTDNNNLACGSYNQEFIISDDVIYWVATNPTQDTIYTGTMNLDGIISAPATEVTGGIQSSELTVNGSNVYIAGSRTNGIDYSPAVINVDPTTNTVVWSVWLNDFYGKFTSVYYDDSTHNLFLVGEMTEEGTTYASLTQVASDGTYVNTVKLSDQASSGRTISNWYSAILVTHSLETGGVVVTAFNASDITTVLWTKGISIGDGDLDIRDSFTIDYDGSGYYLTGFYQSDFYIIKLDPSNRGKVVWQRKFYSEEYEGSGSSNATRMAAVYNQRFAITSYTNNNPIHGGATNSNSITVQLPIDGNYTGIYGTFAWAIFNLDVTGYTSTVGTWSGISTINTELPTYSNNNGFVPNTALLNPNYYPIRGEISGGYSSWKFKDGDMTYPGGGYISTNTYDGSLFISGGDARRDQNYFGSVTLSDGDGNSHVETTNNGVEISHNDAYWYYSEDYNGGVFKQPGLRNNDIQRYKRQVPSDVPTVVWVSQATEATSAKFTVHIDSKTDNPDYENFDTMTCDITLAVKRVNNVNTTAIISVYGVVYTSASPLVTFDAGIVPGGTYTGIPQFDTSGVGVDAEFTIITNNNYSYYIVDAVTNGGSGYFVGDSIRILGGNIGGTNYENDLTFIVNTVDGSSITSVTNLSGITYAGRPYLTCTTSTGTTNECFVKVHARESGSGIMENYC